MCGIAAAIGHPDADALVGRLLAGMAHRGDVTDPVASPLAAVALGTRRLRIVDAAGGAQPKLSFDGRIAVVLNGEIYNHRELRAELEAMGARFSSGSDTEVLATALSVWGGRALRRLNGMYAFVAVDTGTGEFLAARDPLGVKPLYLIQAGDRFVFASELTPLLDEVSEGEVLLLPPGYLLTRSLCAPYRSALGEIPSMTRPADGEALDAALRDAVGRRIPADLPFALMSSGGVDSTLVAHYARQLGHDAPGYLLGGPGAPDFAPAQAYAAASGMELRVVGLPEPADLGARIAQCVQWSESFEPAVVRDLHLTATLSERIHADGYRVALCGEGADELFAGYRPLEIAFEAGGAPGGALREQCLDTMHRSNLQRLDRGSMRWGLEAREPFLDPQVVDHALGLRSEALVQHGTGKAALRALFDRYPGELPRSIRDRRKTPLNEGTGLDRSQADGPWAAFAEATVSDRDLADGRRRYAAFQLRDKEEFLYLSLLAARIDVERVPHLKGRLLLQAPEGLDATVLQAYRAA